MYNGPVSYQESVSPAQVAGTGAALGFGIFTSKLAIDGVKSLVSNAVATPVVIEQSAVDQVVETCSKAVPVVTVMVAGVTLTAAAGKAIKAGWECTKSAGDLATGCFKKATGWFTKKPSDSAPAAAPAADPAAASVASTPAPAAAPAPAASTPAPAPAEKN